MEDLPKVQLREDEASSMARNARVDGRMVTSIFATYL